MDTASATSLPAIARPPGNTLGSPLSAVSRIIHTALDGTVESFANVFDNVSEIVFKREVIYNEPLDGKVAIVTGGNAGIGFATARQLARRGAHVVLACRDKARAEAAVQTIRQDSPLPGCCGTASTASPPVLPDAAAGSSIPAPAVSLPPPLLRVESMELDLGRLSSVRSFAQQWAARGLPLHLLVCNAGVMGPPRRLETPDGLEMQFQVNFLSHWLLANELLTIECNRRLRERTTATPIAALTAAPSAPYALSNAARGATRVVMVTSLTHRAGALQWEDKQSIRGYEPFLSYGLSKLANILTAKELQRRFDRSPIHYGLDTAVAVHPGLVSTDLANGFFASRSTGWAEGTPLKSLVDAAVGGISNVVGPLLMRSPDQSAAIMLHACLAPRTEVAGHYLALGRRAQPDQAAEDPAIAQELWSYAEQLTGCKPHPSLL